MGSVLGPSSGGVGATPGDVRWLYDDAGTSTLFSASALPASGAWRRSETVGVAFGRTLGLWVKYDASASTTAGYPHIIVLGSSEVSQPASGDDSWFELPLRDDSLGTAAALSGTLPTGADYSAGPLRNALVVRGFTTKPMAAVGNSNKIRQLVAFDITCVKWVHVIASEVGDTTNRGTLGLGINISE